MHIVLDIHSLPGGVNFLEIGEAHGQGNWLYREINLELSYEVVDAVLDFIQTSGHVGSYTIAPINEAVNRNDIDKRMIHLQYPFRLVDPMLPVMLA